MRTQNEKSKEDAGPTLRLQIMELSNLGTKKFSHQWSPSFFEPQRELSGDKTTSNTNLSGGSSRRSTDREPEKKLTLFVLRLAILEKMASGVGALGFIWATVVLLGGFAVALKNIDFWFLTTILVIEGTRIYSRSRELEWQHQATRSISGARKHGLRALKSRTRSMLRAIGAFLRPLPGIGPDSNPSQRQDDSSQSIRTQRTWTSYEIPLLAHAQFLFRSSNISRILYWLQLLLAAACVALSLMRLIPHDFVDMPTKETRNLVPALILFYSLALAEASIFLMERLYWEWKISYLKLLEEVNDDCQFGETGLVSIKRFFYDCYSKSINGTIFDGLRMDLADFGCGLLDSDSHDEQLIGARILQKFASHDQFADETLRKIGTSTVVMERLLEMLNWKNPVEEEIRRCAAETLSKLAGKKRNALRVAGIPGAMESVSSLLYSKRSLNCAPHEIGDRLVIADRENYEFSAFNLLGLLILKKLARDHGNCWKIGNTRGLLPKIIDFTSSGQRLLRDDRVTDSQIKTMKRSLQIVKKLVSRTGKTGKLLRREISEIVFTISNIREILQNGENYMNLQKLAIEILTSLAMDKDAREKIGCTGGIFKDLFSIFFKPGLTDMQDAVRVEAGESLTMLALDSTDNCHQILRLKVVRRLVEELDDPIACVNSARILRNLCAYSENEYYFQLRAVTDAIPTVLKAIMSEENRKLEVSIGLATQMFKFASPEESAKGFESSGITESELVEKLVEILKLFGYPSIRVPRMRRNVIELAINLMESDVKIIEFFKNFGMEKELRSVTDTTSELENFNVFSGSVGLSPHRLTLQYLIDTALEKLQRGQN